MDNFEFTKSHFLMCEGDDDKGFLETLIKERGLPDFQVCHAAECNDKNTGGRPGFEHSLAGFSIIKGFAYVKAILIVSDNDTPASFNEVCSALTNNNYTAPSTPNSVGSIKTKPVAILMIPRNKNGDLETLCLPSIHEKWPKSSECVTSFLRCTGADQWQKSSSVNKARARAATVGFNEEDPFRGIGHLFRRGTLSSKNACFDEVAEFLKNFDKMCNI